MKLRNPKNDIVRSRITRRRKLAAEKIFHKLGLTHSEAINLFYAQVELRHGLPFGVNIPNEETAKVLKESKKGTGVKHFSTKKALYEDLGL